MSEAIDPKLPAPPLVDLAWYHEIRKILLYHNNASIRHLKRSFANYTRELLGIEDGSDVSSVSSSDTELIVWVDYSLHAPNGGRTAMDRYLANLPPAGESQVDELTVRKALKNTFYAAFEITDEAKGICVPTRDMQTGESRFIVDRGLSSTVGKGSFLAGRLLPIRDFWITSGAAFPINAQIWVEAQRQLHLSPRASEASESSRGPSAADEPDNNAFAAAIIKFAIRHRTVEQISLEPLEG